MTNPSPSTPNVPTPSTTPMTPLEALEDLVTEATSQPPVEIEVVRRAEAIIRAALAASSVETPAPPAPSPEAAPLGTYACPICGKDTPHRHD